MLLHSSQFHGCMIRFFVPLCCFTAPGFMFLHAVCGSMLYTDPRLILLPPWICCCMPRSFMRTARTSLPFTSQDHTSLLRASLPLVLLLMPCLAVSSVAALCFTAPSLLSHAATSFACRCFILCCSMLCCFMIATPLFSVPPCTFLLACVLCSKFHWSIVYRPILRLCLLRCFILFFSMVRCPMLCGFTHDWPILHCFMPRFSMLCCASCFTVPAVLYAPMFRAYLLHAYADLCLMLRHALCCFMLYTNPCLMLLPPVMLFHASLFHAHFSYFAALYFTGPYLSALLFHALMFYCSMLCCSML